VGGERTAAGESERREQQQERVRGENSSRREWEERTAAGESERREQQQERVGGERTAAGEI